MEIVYGECHCGCKQKTPIQTKNVPLRGYVVGAPSKFCLGHNARRPRPIVEQPYDPSIRYIPLTKGQIAIVDTFLYEWLNTWDWIAYYDPKLDGYYASRRLRKHEGSSGESKISMHVLIFKEHIGVIADGNVVDHKNRASLDNRIGNLRQATPKQNGVNQKVRRSNKTGVTGVFWCNTHKYYVVGISVDGTHKTVARCKNLEDARIAREESEIKYYGEFKPS